MKHASPEIAEIAHELRAPLGGIDSMIELLEASGLDPKQRTIVVALKASCAHLRAIADLVLAGRGAGESAVSERARPQPAAFDNAGDIVEFLDPLIVAARARCAVRGLAFSARVAEALRGCRIGAPGPLRQVLENLIDNATRLSRAGTIVLEIAPAGGGRVEFSLSDEGPGLSSEDATRLIHAGGAIANRAGGAGLGLSISGRIVAEHGGRLRGGPNPAGAGARFGFDWPAPFEPAHAALCLIVDDHAASRLVIRTILAAGGHPCIEASSVSEALHQVDVRRPAVILTDLNMPEGGGIRLVEGLCGLAPENRPRLIVVSADELDPASPQFPMIDGAIRKPVTVRAVLETVRAVLDGAHGRAA